MFSVSQYYHDSTAALERNGDIVAAAQKNGLRAGSMTRVSQETRWSIAYGKRERSLDLHYAVFYENPINKFDHLMEASLAFAPKGIETFGQFVLVWARSKLHLGEEIKECLGEGRIRWGALFADHHERTPRSGFPPSHSKRPQS
jgi:carbamoyltransferase